MTMREAVPFGIYRFYGSKENHIYSKLKPSQPHRIISGLRETLTKRYIVKRNTKADIRPENQSEEAERYCCLSMCVLICVWKVAGTAGRAFPMVVKFVSKRLGAEQNQLPFGSTGTSSPRCRENLWNERQLEGP